MKKNLILFVVLFLFGGMVCADNSGKTNLHEAVKKGSFDDVTNLLDTGIDVTIKDNNGMTALDYAVARYVASKNDGDFDIIWTLIKFVNGRPDETKTMFLYEILKSILSVTKPETRKNIDKIEYVQNEIRKNLVYDPNLIFESYDKNDKDKKHITYFKVIYDMRNDCPNIYKAFDERLNQVEDDIKSLKNKFFDTDYKQEAFFSEQELIKMMKDFLNKNKLSVGNYRDKTGKTLLHLVIEDVCLQLNKKDLKIEEKNNILKKLRYKIDVIKTMGGSQPGLSADMNSKDFNGMTPLHIAVQRGVKEVIEIFIKYCAGKFDIQDDFGETPLHYAALLINLDIFDLLMKNGANTNIQNISRQTQMHYLIDKHYMYSDCIEYLTRPGVNVEPLYEYVWNNYLLKKSFHKKDSESVEMMKKIKDALLNNLKASQKDFEGKIKRLQIDANERKFTIQFKEIYVRILNEAIKDGSSLSNVKSLIDKCIDINMVDPRIKKTPLEYAIETKNLDVVEILVDKGALIDDKTKKAIQSVSNTSMPVDQAIAKFLEWKTANIFNKPKLKKEFEALKEESRKQFK